ncbi:LysR family transcriptional regulator [Vibrio albus]|uniref:LysR family transcriptional regulator n=1 Tax=Vibrio albus TaxID=2200953 RepID=A0A2U3B6M6_9VIBR|nr:LysR substrate-binding domain-containing protein [Vibrio albus]PWI32449.1 LysR family transcriptional regulator [Vibrio albus]
MRKILPLKSIYAFVAVAETGSMTEAAKALNVSHSAISQSIKSLEAQLKQPLFQRVGRQVKLNPQGKKYYKEVAPALEKIVNATEAIINPPNSNRIMLNMVNSLAIHWWVPKVGEFQQYAPDIDVRLSNLIGPFDLDQEGVDVAIIHGKTEEWQDYYCEKLGDDELVLVCSPDLLDEDNQPSPDDLIKRYPAIYAENLRRKHDWKTWCQTNQFPVPRQRRNLSFIASIQAVQAAIRKLGILVTHRLFVRDDIKHGLLIEIGDPVKNPHQDFYFACQPEKLRQDSVLTLRSWLREEFKNTMSSD